MKKAAVVTLAVVLVVVAGYSIYELNEARNQPHRTVISLDEKRFSSRIILQISRWFVRTLSPQ